MVPIPKTPKFDFLLPTPPIIYLSMRPLTIPLPTWPVSPAWIVSCLPSANMPKNDDVFDTSSGSDCVQDSNVVADITSSIPRVESDLFHDAEETPMLMGYTSTDLDRNEYQYFLNNASVDSISIGADVGISSDTKSQIAEGDICLGDICLGDNRRLWCCPTPDQWVGCVFFNGEPWGVCKRSNQYCCSQKCETKDPYECEKTSKSVFEHLKDFLRASGAQETIWHPMEQAAGF